MAVVMAELEGAIEDLALLVAKLTVVIAKLSVVMAKIKGMMAELSVVAAELVVVGIIVPVVSLVWVGTEEVIVIFEGQGRVAMYIKKKRYFKFTHIIGR